MWTAAMRGGLVALPVLLLGLWSQLWLERALETEARSRTRALGSHLRAAVSAAQASLTGEVERLCRFDRRVDRLRAELEAAAPRDDARRSLTAIVTTLELDSLAVEAPDGAGALKVEAEPSESKSRGAYAAGVPLEASCELKGGFRLRARRSLALPDTRPEGVHVALERTSPAPANAWLEVWAPPASSTFEPRLWLRVQPPARPVAALQAGTALALVLAFGLGVWTRRRRAPSRLDPETTALTAIERAAARVARGDLASHIGLTTGTSADRTLTAFNRMTEELRVTREKLMKAERAAAWQDMARRIAHEIKNPLSPIRTAMETLRKAHARGLPEFDEIFQESSLAILEEVERLQRIVREFSEFARLPKPVPGAIDLRDTAQHALSVARHQGVPIALVAPDELPPARADREQLTQVLLNLLQNACAAAAEGDTESPHVELRLHERPGHLAVEVHDNGPGVPPETRAQIFQPYFTQREQGSGLGLTIAARIVEEHGSTLEVDDSPLGGALFRFDLPLEHQGAG